MSPRSTNARANNRRIMTTMSTAAAASTSDSFASSSPPPSSYSSSSSLPSSSTALSLPPSSSQPPLQQQRPPSLTTTTTNSSWRPRSLRSALYLLAMASSVVLGSMTMSTAEGAIFEVPVRRPTTTTSTTTTSSNSTLLDSSKFFMSKYQGNAIVTNAQNLGYAGTIELGNPPQSFEVIYDTGSDMIVITSNLCTGLHCAVMPHYTCTSCAKTQYSYNITYGDGTWGAGPIVTDQVSIGGLVIQNQQILDITQSGLDMSSYGVGIAGLVGLMPNSPVAKSVPPLQTILNSKLLDQNVFSVYLAATLDKDQGGTFLFGGIDSTKYSGTLNFVPISTASTVRQGMWYIDADGAYVGSTAVPGYVKSPWLFDTGTSFIAVPTTFATSFHASVPGAKYSAVDQVYTVPCTGNTTFGVSFNGIKYYVPYEDYVARASSTATTCVSLVMPLGDYEMFILGDPFLRQVYAVYDFTPGNSGIRVAAVNVSNPSLGTDGLSGDPVSGGTVIGSGANAGVRKVLPGNGSNSLGMLAMAVLVGTLVTLL